MAGSFLRIGAAQEVVFAQGGIKLSGPGLVQGAMRAEVELGLKWGQGLAGGAIRPPSMAAERDEQLALRYVLDQAESTWTAISIPGATSEVVVPITPGADGAFEIEVLIQW